MARTLTALALAAGTAGCAVNASSTVSAFAEQTGANSFEVIGKDISSEDALVLPVVHDRQTVGSSCGAHALASVINYWNEAAGVTGRELFLHNPPASPAGYSMAELVTLAGEHGLLAGAVRLSTEVVLSEIEQGRPVLVPVRLPSVYVQGRTLPGDELPVLGFVRGALMDRAVRVAELGDAGLVDHYLLVVGHDGDRLVVVEPVRGYRTISRERLERYRAAFDAAAIVFSAAPARS